MVLRSVKTIKPTSGQGPQVGSATETFGSYCLNMGAGQSILFQNYFQTFQSLKMEILQNRK